MFLDKFQEKSETLNVIALSVQELSRFCRRGVPKAPFPPSLNRVNYDFRHSFAVGIQAKRFSSIDFHRFPIPVDKNHLIADCFYRFRFLSIDNSGSPGCNCTRIYTDVILKGWQIQILKNWAPTNLANTSHQKKILNLVLIKR